MSEIYFNEIESFPAKWLQNYWAVGAKVDERSIKDVEQDDITGFQRCHFFAGIGGWELALQQAWWPENVPVWTGSCPCQPFSAAGLGKGTEDDRHLWPEFLRLIAACRPPNIFGEQVSGRKVTGKLFSPRAFQRLEPEDLRAAEEADQEAWFKHVQTDLERLGYIVGSVSFPACSVGAPHARQRLYWYARYVGDSSECYHGSLYRKSGKSIRQEEQAGGSGISCELANLCGEGLEGWEEQSARKKLQATERGGCTSGSIADTWSQVQRGKTESSNNGRKEKDRSSDQFSGCCSICDNRPGPTNGHWRAADWISCRDNKWRPVEPGSSPLADGISAKSPGGRSELARMARASRKEQLAGYGNAIVIPQAVEFIRACMEEIM